MYLALEVVCSETSNEQHCNLFNEAMGLSGHETLAPLVISLDHQSGRWSAKNRLEGAGKGRIEFDVAGQPTVSLSSDERIVVVVDNTNALFYTGIPGKPTEEDVPELTEIKKLFAALGGGLQVATKVISADVSDPSFAPELAGQSPIRDFSAEVLTKLEAMELAALKAECATDQTTTQTGRAIAFLQDLELGGDASYSYVPPTPTACPDGADRIKHEAVTKGFDGLHDAIIEPRRRLEDCAQLFDAAHAVLKADPSDPKKVLDAVATYNATRPPLCPNLEALVAEIDKVIQPTCANSTCGVTGAATRALTAAQDVARQEADFKRRKELGIFTPEGEQLAKKDAEKLRDDAKKAHESMKEELNDGTSFAQLLLRASLRAKDLGKLRKEAEVILARRGDVQKAAAQVEAFERRIEGVRIGALAKCEQVDGTWSAHSVEVDCVKREHLDLRIILEPQLKGVRATKIQKHTLKVKKDSAYHEKVVATRPAELDAAYHLDSVLRGLWGVSASMIYTELANPTFGAVTSKDDPMKMVIAQTDEETRAGEIALLADFRFARWLACRGDYSPGCTDRWNWLGVEIGAGLGDDAAFFGGLSFRLPRSQSWRLGVGYTYQQVEELNKQVLGDVVASGDDIKTRDDFEGDWYISLSFALESLSLFSSGD